MTRTVWIEPLAGPTQKAVLTTALEQGFATFLFPGAVPAALRGLGRFAAIVEREDGTLLDGEAMVGRRVVVARPQDQASVAALAGRAQHVLVEATDWKVIPLENLIADFQGKGSRLLASVGTAKEARLVLETLEVGVDGVCLATSAPGEVRALAGILSAASARSVALSRARVLEVRPVGTGDRVCVDTASLLTMGEGMLVGSQSGALFLVHSECVESGYVASRPFRVNAGPVHAYVLLPDGRTKYLCELAAGDEVLVVNAKGEGRSATVGRVKVEKRPLLLVRAEAGGREAVTLLQNAETVRLVTADGAKSVAELAAGDEVLVRIEDAGRHFGRPVKESIMER